MSNDDVATQLQKLGFRVSLPALRAAVSQAARTTAFCTVTTCATGFMAGRPAPKTSSSYAPSTITLSTRAAGRLCATMRVNGRSWIPRGRRLQARHRKPGAATS